MGESPEHFVLGLQLGLQPAGHLSADEAVVVLVGGVLGEAGLVAARVEQRRELRRRVVLWRVVPPPTALSIPVLRLLFAGVALLVGDPLPQFALPPAPSALGVRALAFCVAHFNNAQIK